MRMWARVWLDSASVTAAKQGLDTTNKHFRKHDRGPFVRSWDDQALIGNGEARAAHYFSPFYGMCSCIRLEDEHFASWTNILDISHCFQAYKNHCSSYWIPNNGFDRGIIVHTSQSLKISAPISSMFYCTIVSDNHLWGDGEGFLVLR